MVRYSSKDQSATILKTMFDTKYHADAELLSGTEGKSILAHKAVLSSASEYFQVMFASSFKEAVESKVTLKDIEPHILEAIINFLYCGFIDIPDAETAIQLMKNAHLMKLPELMKHSADYLKKNITAETCLEMHLLAKQFEEDDLLKEVNDFIVTNFKSVSKQDEFQILNIDSVVDIISARNDSTSEDALAEGVLDWIAKDEEREKHFKELLYLLQIESISRKELVDKIQAKCTEKDDVDHIIESLKKRFFGKPKAPVSKTKTRKLHLLLVEEYYPGELGLYEYDFTSREYKHQQMVHIYGIPLGICESKIVFAFQQEKIIIYDLIKRRASPPIESTDDVKILACAKIDNFMFVLTETGIYKFVWDNRVLNRMEKVEDDFGGIYEFDAFCEHNDDLKVVVHKKYDPHSLIVYNYDPINEEWDMEQTALITKTDGSGLGVKHDNALYFFKGSFLHVYHFEDMSWDTHKKLNLPERHKTDNPEITEVTSINEKLVLTVNDKIYEYSGGFHKIYLPKRDTVGRVLPLL